jgi:hypothetical protein
VWFINQRSQVEPSVAFFASLKLTVTTARIGSKANCRRSVVASWTATGPIAGNGPPEIIVLKRSFAACCKLGRVL